MLSVKSVVRSTSLFLLYNGGELHQVLSVWSTGCSVGLLSSRFGALCLSHLVAAATHHSLFDKEFLGLLFVSLQHGCLLILTTEPSRPVLLFLIYFLVGVGVRWYKSLGNFLYNLTPIYTTAVKVLQLYQNYRAGHTGMLSSISTLHILLLSVYYLLNLPSDNIRIRIILIVCFVSNLIQLGQCWRYWDESERVVGWQCGAGEERVFVMTD
ncbi:hypothetical protein ACHWQZ_G011127 [Mnemiopsis leidyi]